MLLTSAHSRRLLSNSLFRAPTVLGCFNATPMMTFAPQRPMSTFFKDLDEKSRKKLAWAMNEVPEYEKIQRRWKTPLETKKRRKAEREEKERNQEPVPSQEAVVYVHSPEKGVALPAHPDEIFAVMRIAGKQTKVLNNDIVRVEKLPFQVGAQICIDDILMIGTCDYTAIGRPQVENAKIYATVEQEVQTEKSIIFKKNRRKGYQKSQGHRQVVHLLRIDRIVHELTEEDFSLEAQQASRMQLMKTPSQTYNIII